MSKTPQQKDETPAMPFNDALKKVWAAKPMPKVKSKPAKPQEPDRSGKSGG